MTSELNWFQSLGPRNEIDFCPFDVLKRGTFRSASMFLSLIVVGAEFCTNSSDSYSGARLLVDLYILVAVLHRIMSDIVGHPSLVIRSAAETRKLLLVTFLTARFCNFVCYQFEFCSNIPTLSNNSESGVQRFLCTFY